MNALAKLWLFKQKATIRNLFRKASSAILTVLMVLLYGGMIVMLLSMPKDATAQLVDPEMAILLGIGMGAILSLSQLVQKRKALFMEEDSFYLFSGPFSRKQVMRYLMAQTILQSVLFALVAAFIMISFGTGSGFTLGFVLACVLAFALLFFFFLTFTDYLYILSITNKKYKAYARFVAIGFVVLVIAVYGFALLQNNFQFDRSLMAFAQDKAFYVVPMFGWVKLALSSLLHGDMMLCYLGYGLLLVANVILYLCFTSFKGDFYEQAMMDSIEVTNYMKQIKAGKQSTTKLNAKVRNSNVTFRQGAGAIFSKNFLMMKKTGDFIRLQEIGILVFYFIITLMTDLNFGMFCYMMVIYIFQILQTSDLVQELKNYQIYLIPDKPFAKLCYAILPTLMKITLISSAAVVVSGLFYRQGLMEIFGNLIMLIGYTFVFVSGTVLSIRILKSRTNVFMENLLRMFVIIACSIPSVGLIIWMIFSQGIYDVDALNMASYLSLVLNFVLSFLILFACKNMMNGREINSD